MSRNTCPQLQWCEENHTAPNTSDDFHIRHDNRKAGLGVLRTDLVLDEGKPSVEIQDYIDWSIPLPQMPAFIAELRAEIDRIEALTLKFSALMNPLVRTTEPGTPDLDGRGGGL